MTLQWLKFGRDGGSVSLVAPIMQEMESRSVSDRENRFRQKNYDNTNQNTGSLPIREEFDQIETQRGKGLEEQTSHPRSPRAFKPRHTPRRQRMANPPLEK